MTYRVDPRAEAMVRATEGLAARLGRVALRREIRRVAARALFAAAAIETVSLAWLTARLGAHASFGAIVVASSAAAFALSLGWARRAEAERSRALLRRVSDVARAAITIPKGPLQEALALVRARRDDGLLGGAAAIFLTLPLVLLVTTTPVTGLRLGAAALFFATPPVLFFVWVGRIRSGRRTGTALLGLLTMLGYAAFGLLGLFDTSASIIAALFGVTLVAPIVLRIAFDRALHQEAHDLAMLDASIDFAALKGAADAVVDALGEPASDDAEPRVTGARR